MNNTLNTSAIIDKDKTAAVEKQLCYNALPKTVVDVINNNYPVKEAKYVQKIITFIDNVPSSRKKFVYIRSTEFKDQISYKKYENKYAKYIEFLGQNKFIKINHSYSNKANGYTKSYKSNLQKYENTEWIVLTTFNKKYKNKIVDIENQCDVRFKKQFLYSLHHEHQLIFCDDLSNLKNIVKKSELNMLDCYYHKITQKVVTARNSNSASTRFYFNSVMMKNEHKHFLRYKSSNNEIKKLVNYDFSSFVPTIIKWLAINNNKQFSPSIIMWTPILEAIKKEMCAIYINIQNKLKLQDRSVAKEKFSQFRNATKIKKQYLPLYNLLKEMNQSDMIDVMENTDWRVYDEIETTLLADISDIAEKHNLVFIRQHDGWLTTEQDGVKIMTELEKIGLTNLFDIKATPLGQ